MSDEAESQAQRLSDEGERVERRIEETRSEVQSKAGSVPGVAPPDEDEVAIGRPEPVADDGEQPNETSTD